MLFHLYSCQVNRRLKSEGKRDLNPYSSQTLLPSELLGPDGSLASVARIHASQMLIWTWPLHFSISVKVWLNWYTASNLSSQPCWSPASKKSFTVMINHLFISCTLTVFMKPLIIKHWCAFGQERVKLLIVVSGKWCHISQTTSCASYIGCVVPNGEVLGGSEERWKCPCLGTGPDTMLKFALHTSFYTLPMVLMPSINTIKVLFKGLAYASIVCVNRVVHVVDSQCDQWWVYRTITTPSHYSSWNESNCCPFYPLKTR